MGLRLKAFALGTVEVNPVDTASNVSVDVQAANGVLSYADSATGGFYLPTGTTAQRPASPVAGQTRYNSTNSQPEYYNGTAWVAVNTVYVSTTYLVVAGGGGATNSDPPSTGYTGGNGGQVLKGTTNVTVGVSYTVTVGGGGGNSSVSVLSLTANAGGGASGGIGNNAGGATGTTTGLPIVGTNPGVFSGGQYWVGGGGGAGGQLDTYQQGGGGGLGGGGHGAGDINTGSGTYATSGAVNTGGGAGGGNYTPSASPGSGVVAFSYAGDPRGTGGTISTLNGYTVHIFNSSGTFLLTS